MTRPIARDVAAVFQGYPPPVRKRLLRVRDLIYETAAATPGVGPLEEALKWGQPSYLTAQSGSGTTVRIDRARASDDVAVYVSCLTDLVATYREQYPKLHFEGNRAIVFPAAGGLDETALRHCVALALTYHLHKKLGRGAQAGAPRRSQANRRRG